MFSLDPSYNCVSCLFHVSCALCRVCLFFGLRFFDMNVDSFRYHSFMCLEFFSYQIV